MKRLRKNNDRMIFGVCGALGEYFALDPVILRLAFVVGALAFGTGILLYLILAIVIPSKTTDETPMR
jgi:phage shock protein C